MKMNENKNLNQQIHQLGSGLSGKQIQITKVKQSFIEELNSTLNSLSQQSRTSSPLQNPNSILVFSNSQTQHQSFSQIDSNDNMNMDLYTPSIQQNLDLINLKQLIEKLIKRLKRGKMIENSLLFLEDGAKRAFEKINVWLDDRDQKKLHETLTTRLLLQNSGDDDEINQLLQLNPLEQQQQQTIEENCGVLPWDVQLKKQSENYQYLQDIIINDKLKNENFPSSTIHGELKLGPVFYIDTALEKKGGYLQQFAQQLTNNKNQLQYDNDSDSQYSYGEEDESDFNQSDQRMINGVIKYENQNDDSQDYKLDQNQNQIQNLNRNEYENNRLKSQQNNRNKLEIVINEEMEQNLEEQQWLQNEKQKKQIELNRLKILQEKKNLYMLDNIYSKPILDMPQGFEINTINRNLIRTADQLNRLQTQQQQQQYRNQLQSQLDSQYELNNQYFSQSEHSTPTLPSSTNRQNTSQSMRDNSHQSKQQKQQQQQQQYFGYGRESPQIISSSRSNQINLLPFSENESSQQHHQQLQSPNRSYSNNSSPSISKQIPSYRSQTSHKYTRSPVNIIRESKSQQQQRQNSQQQTIQLPIIPSQLHSYKTIQYLYGDQSQIENQPKIENSITIKKISTTPKAILVKQQFGENQYK